jgi:hypothetical protein
MRSRLRSIPEAENARPRAKAPPIIIAPSILSADFARLGDEVRAVGTKDYSAAIAAIRANAAAAAQS